MSNAIFHNLESGSNELQSGFSENQFKLIEKADTQRYLAKCRIQNLVVYNTLPESFACLFDPQRTFGNPLRAVFSKIEIFFWYSEIFLSIRGGVLECLLGFWPSGPKPCGGNYRPSGSCEGVRKSGAVQYHNYKLDKLQSRERRSCLIERRISEEI